MGKNRNRGKTNKQKVGGNYSCIMISSFCKKSFWGPKPKLFLLEVWGQDSVDRFTSPGITIAVYFSSFPKAASLGFENVDAS